jgi:hypothetical protein
MDEGLSGGLALFPPKWVMDLPSRINGSGADASRDWAGRLR